MLENALRMGTKRGQSLFQHGKLPDGTEVKLALDHRAVNDDDEWVLLIDPDGMDIRFSRSHGPLPQEN
jgi:hypothetical protein